MVACASVHASVHAYECIIGQYLISEGDLGRERRGQDHQETASDSMIREERTFNYLLWLITREIRFFCPIYLAGALVMWAELLGHPSWGGWGIKSFLASLFAFALGQLSLSRLLRNFDQFLMCRVFWPHVGRWPWYCALKTPVQECMNTCRQYLEYSKP